MGGGQAHQLRYERLPLQYHARIGHALGHRTRRGVHRDPLKNYIIPLLFFEKYAQAIVSKMLSFREVMELLAVKDEQLQPNLLRGERAGA